MHRANPYPPARPTAAPVAPDATVFPLLHKFIYIATSWCFPVHSDGGPTEDTHVFGRIQWNERIVPCRWTMLTEGQAGTLQLFFHYEGREDAARSTVYVLILTTTTVRIWRSEQFGGQYLVQIP